LSLPAALPISEKTGRCHADDRERDPLERDTTANHIGRTSEVPLPETVTDDRHWAVRSAAAPVVVRIEAATHQQRRAQRVEEAAARPDAVDSLRLTATGEVEPNRRPRECASKPVGTRPNGFPDRIGPRRRRTTFPDNPQP